MLTMISSLQQNHPVVSSYVVAEKILVADDGKQVPYSVFDMVFEVTGNYIQ